MNPIARALLQSWDWRIEVILPLLAAAWLFLRGWRRLRAIASQRTPGQRTNSWAPLTAAWKPVSYLAGLLILAVALMSPIDVLGSQLFYMHMIQHLLLVMIVPPLLFIASPFPIIMWGLPGRTRRRIGGLLNQSSPLRRLLTKITAPGPIWFLYIVVYIGWHDPGMYDAALGSDFVHDLEHITFFATAMLFWWHVTAAGPRFHRSFSTAKRLFFVISAIPANMFTGIAIAFATQPIYTYYTTVPRLYGLSVMEDQMLSGVIMWIPGSMMFLLVALIMIGRMVQSEVDKPVDPNPSWMVDDATDSAVVR